MSSNGKSVLQVVATVFGICLGILTLLGATVAFAWGWHSDSSKGIEDNKGRVDKAEVRIGRNERDIQSLDEKLGGLADQLGEVKTTVVEIKTIQTAQKEQMEKMDGKLDTIIKEMPRGGPR